MITVINKSNKGVYNQLFQDVEKWLYAHDAAGQLLLLDQQGGENALLKKVTGTDPVTGEPTEDKETINSLEELFQFMSFITNAADASIYTRLPLDEEPFFIDANSRTISVPKDFAANGVSVQGDEIAEILFFKINRFFDATDFNECKIFIQWKSSETDQYGNFKQGVSRPWIQDIESEPGYLIFGWPISSAITKEAGTVTFSVRFYRLDTNNQLLYSFSTLDQTVTIKPALDYDIEDIANDTSKIYVEDMTSRIMDRAVDSVTPSENGLAPEIPVWDDGVEESLTGWTQVYKEDGVTVKYQIMNLNIDENTDFSTKPIVLHTAALTEDTGMVLYKWKKLRNGTESTFYMSDDETQFWKPVDYIVNEDTDAQRDNRKTYYKKEGDSYKSILPSESLDALREDEQVVYELVSTAILDEVGRYTASARNRVGKAFSEDLIADDIYVPAPKAPELGELEATGTTGNILREDPVYVGIEVTLKDQFDNNVDGQGGKATYVWRRRALDGETPDVLENDTAAVLTLTPNGENNASLEGWYSVIVTNNLNKKTISTPSGEIRVTNPALKPILTIGEDDDLSLADAQDGISVSVSGIEPEGYRTDDDAITYQWYKYVPAGSQVEVDKAAARNGNYELHGDLKIADLGLDDSLTELAVRTSTTPTFYPPVSGVYFCLVTNTYNDTVAETVSPFYNIV